MKRPLSQTALLRMAAFLVDALGASLMLLLPATIASYSLAWTGASGKPITMVWFVTGGILVAFVLFRDVARGRSPGKRLLGLRLSTPGGKPPGLLRRLLRNVPLVIPPWNLLEVLLLLSGRARSGDRIAGTQVIEE